MLARSRRPYKIWLTCQQGIYLVCTDRSTEGESASRCMRLDWFDDEIEHITNIPVQDLQTLRWIRQFACS